MDIIGSLILFYCAPVRTCITSLLDMAINFNWFIKVTRSFGSGFQSQNIAKPKVRLIIIENRSKQTFLPDQIKEHFGLWTDDSFIAYCFFSYVSIMFITIMSVALWAWPSRDSDIVFDFPIPNPTQRHLLLLYVAILGNADPWIFSVSASTELRTVSCPLRLVSRHRCAELRFVLLSEVLKGSQVSPIFVLTRMIASGSSQLCAFSCKINV
jgi:hypothetical protein